MERRVPGSHVKSSEWAEQLKGSVLPHLPEMGLGPGACEGDGSWGNVVSEREGSQGAVALGQQGPRSRDSGKGSVSAGGDEPQSLGPRSRGRTTPAAQGNPLPSLARFQKGGCCRFLWFKPPIGGPPSSRNRKLIQVPGRGALL